ncbi:MAG: helix-turn-helix transcriptional regulator [Oscillospiraceae bacterium]|nr:helix-turn-helix transcriptional regulator [Oscillospiraceae bacterium]
MIMYPELDATLIRSGIDRKEASEFLGIAYDSLNKRMQGKTKFSLEEGKELSALLGVPVEELFRRAEEPQDKTA